MWWTLGKGLANAYGVLWIAAVGGILGANWLGLVGVCLVTDDSGAEIQWWSHLGWYVGTLLFFVGAASGRVRATNGTGMGWRPRRQGNSTSSKRSAVPAESVTDSRSVATADTTPRASGSSRRPKQAGLLGCILGGTIVGGFCSFLFGASLVVFVFSLAYSPFAPKQLVSSTKVERPNSYDSPSRNSFRIQNPVATTICLAPGVLGTVAGAVAGGVIWFLYRHEQQPADEVVVN